MHIASRLAESGPYFHSRMFVCLSVIRRPTAYHDWSITTKFDTHVHTCPCTGVSLFGSLAPILELGAKICKFSPTDNFKLLPFRHLDTNQKKPTWVDAYVDGQYCTQIIANSIKNCRTSRVLQLKNMQIFGRGSADAAVAAAVGAAACCVASARPRLPRATLIGCQLL